MRVLLLSPYGDQIAKAIRDAGDEVGTDPLALEWHEPDWIVSYGCRQILRRPFVDDYAGKIINIHTSLLPWGRGAYPNLFSWYDNTPKGVTIHFIDSGVDTGDIIASEQIIFEPECVTLATSYRVLSVAAEALFAKMWPAIRKGTTGLRQDLNAGSSHKKKDLEAIWPLLKKGWDTPVTEVMELGRKERERSGKSNRNLDQVRVG